MWFHKGKLKRLIFFSSKIFSNPKIHHKACYVSSIWHACSKPWSVLQIRIITNTRGTYAFAIVVWFMVLVLGHSLHRKHLPADVLGHCGDWRARVENCFIYDIFMLILWPQEYCDNLQSLFQTSIFNASWVNYPK